jgi:hypothetical protein
LPECRQKLDKRRSIEEICDVRSRKVRKQQAAFADAYPTQKLIQKWIDGEAEHMACNCPFGQKAVERAPPIKVAPFQLFRSTLKSPNNE